MKVTGYGNKKKSLGNMKYLVFIFLLSMTFVVPFYLQQSQAPKISRAAAINAHENPNEMVLSEEDRKRGYVEGEVIVGYDKTEIDLENKNVPQNIKLYLSTLGIEKNREIDKENIRVYKDKNTVDLKESFETKENVEYVEPNYVVELYADTLVPTDPNDSRFGEQWGLDNKGLYGGTAGVDIKAKQAWEITDKYNTAVRIGVIDTGIDYTHPELVENIYINPNEFPASKFQGLDANNDNRITIDELKLWSVAPLKDFDGDGTINLKDIFFPLNNENKFRDGVDDDKNGYIDDFFGWDFYNNDNDPFDKNGHGTNIAGIIAGKRNNSLGIAGINRDAQLIPLKVFGSQGEMSTTAPIVEAIAYANNNSIPITNSSLGMVLSKDKKPQSLEDAISVAATKGYLFFTASGNGKRNENNELQGFDLDNGSETVYPAAYDFNNIVAVGGSTDEDGISPSSNFGANSVDILAPGRSILTTKPSEGYGVYNGTSVATPHVTAVASILWAYSQNYLKVTPSATDIKDDLIDFSLEIPSLGNKFVKDSSGRGAKRLDFYNVAVNVLPASGPVEPIVTPTELPIASPTNPIQSPITKEQLDLVSNGKVGIEDFAMFITLYKSGDSKIDYNGNGNNVRDIGDFMEFTKNYPKYAGK
ncbi:S8 family serine peptidase [Candidatus Dojkabacteria bacterium]|nr:S8 family serine peptidase [Candidatus Dojkabacteria bacterium]